MAETVRPAIKTPWHLWVVGIVSLLWNAVGAMDFTLTQLRSEAYLKDFTSAQREYFLGFPWWVVAAWGVATWGSVAGSLLLLLCRSLAFQLLLVSFVGMMLTFLQNYILTDGLKVMGGGVGPVIFSAAIMVIGLLLLVYARAMSRSGVIR